MIQPDANVTAQTPSDYSNNGADTLVDAKLQLNGQDRFSVRQAGYFNLVQPYQHHTRIPAMGIYVYSFALNPEQHQPSGSVNMSRIDNATMIMNLSTGTNPVQLRVYAVNYNVFKSDTKSTYYCTKGTYCASEIRIEFCDTFKLREPPKASTTCLQVKMLMMMVLPEMDNPQPNAWLYNKAWVQRLNVSGEISIFLRYSLAPKRSRFIKCTERWGISDELWRA